LKIDHRKRLIEAGSDSFMRERLSEWVLDSSERIVKETKEKSEQRLKDSTRNLNAQSKILNSASLYQPK